MPEISMGLVQVIMRKIYTNLRHNNSFVLFFVVFDIDFIMKKD